MNKETSEKYNRFKEQCMTMNFLYLTEKYFYCNEENKQLKANNDEAIEYLKYALDEEKETPSKHNDWRLDLLDLLERGKK